MLFCKSALSRWGNSIVDLLPRYWISELMRASFRRSNLDYAKILDQADENFRLPAWGRNVTFKVFK